MGCHATLCAAPDLRFAREATMGLEITFTLVSTKVNPNLVSENIIKVFKIIFGDCLPILELLSINT